MKIDAFAFGTTNWAEVETTEHRGETGVAYWRTRFFGEKPNQIRVRMVEYTLAILRTIGAKKGTFFFCLEGELETTLEDGRKFVLTTGMSYQVGDNAEPHQSYTKTGAKLFIVD